jgi:hypothetical protein
MGGVHDRRMPVFVLLLMVCLLAWITHCLHAQEPAAPAKAAASQAGDSDAQSKSKDNQAKDNQAKDNQAKDGKGAAKGFDPAVVSAGRAAFERSCTTCHDAARSLERTKDLAGWRATVRRMAAKRGADIATEDIEPIAVYLTSLKAPAGGAAAGKEGEAATAGAAAAAPASDTSSMSAFATISPQWRGDSNHLQNPGFGPLAFVGASWQSKIVSARVTVCVTCHGVNEPSLISRVDLLEVAARVDLTSWLECYLHGLKGGIDAGRFVVPFGAFSAQVNPGVYRTVSTPLIFNMGERIFNNDIGFPVLPMPYADTGVNLNLDIPVCKCGDDPITVTVDAYLVNGIQGSPSGIDFLETRNLFDYNDRAAGGTRVTIGDPYVRVGASYTTGRFDDPNTSGVPQGLYYAIYGCDVQAHYKKLIRCQFEYARRDSDRSGLVGGGNAVFSEGVYGYYAEAEGRPYNECKVSLLVRYDSQTHSSQLPPSGSSLPNGFFTVQRLTVGVNFELWHQSLLMVNYERWLLPEPDHRTADIFGVRYTVTF